MLCDPTELSDVRLWMVRWLVVYLRLWRRLFARWPQVASHWGGSLVSSFMIAAVPLAVGGVIACLLTYADSGFRPFSIGLILALVEMGLTPFLLHVAITDAYRHLWELKPKFCDADISDKLRESTLESIQSGLRFFIIVPLVTLCVLLAVLYFFNGYPWGVKLWGAVTAGWLAYLGAIGSWSILEMVRLNDKVCASDLKLEPFHPDESGGLKILGGLGAKSTLYFSTAVLYFPIAFEFVEKIAGKIGVGWTGIGWTIVLAIFGGFVLVGLYAFVKSQLAVRRKIRSLKHNCIVSSQKELEGMISRLEKSDQSLGIAEIARPATYYFVYHRRLREIKEWSYDFGMILRLAISFVLPLAILLLELYSKLW